MANANYGRFLLIVSNDTSGSIERCLDRLRKVRSALLNPPRFGSGSAHFVALLVDCSAKKRKRIKGAIKEIKRARMERRQGDSLLPSYALIHDNLQQLADSTLMPDLHAILQAATQHWGEPGGPDRLPDDTFANFRPLVGPAGSLFPQALQEYGRIIEGSSVDGRFLRFAF
ncbi:uncharacterized protein LOC129592712 [Paramacrobiotus metropolitanus]|uniref:uncharacterized protein LOC129592712 n=1 Tax=Paramacrobiotus metropolitanus TaxID=2943436 RepID=UPI00244642F9|nr:uncharacterized protein LOC129592712 [Paramacrobiotus metropolitanus]